MNEPLSTGFIGIYVLLTLPESLVKIYKEFKKIWPSDGKNHVAKLNIFGQNAILEPLVQKKYPKDEPAFLCFA